MDSKPPFRINNLPLEILIEILKLLPSFSCLWSLVLSHRAFNEVWKAYSDEIVWAITSDDAINLMLEQLYPRNNIAAASKTLACSKLPIEDIRQLYTNEVHIDILEKHRSDTHKFWRGCPLPGSGSKDLNFRRAAYRAGLYMLTMELPRGYSMCDTLSLMELSEMHCAVKDFQSRPGWPGSSAEISAEIAAKGLEEVMKQRISDYAKCDPTVSVVYVYVLENSYAWLNLKDSGFKDSDFLRYAEELEENENRWRKKVGEEKLK